MALRISASRALALTPSFSSMPAHLGARTPLSHRRGSGDHRAETLTHTGETGFPLAHRRRVRRYRCLFPTGSVNHSGGTRFLSSQSIFEHSESFAHRRESSSLFDHGASPLSKGASHRSRRRSSNPTSGSPTDPLRSLPSHRRFPRFTRESTQSNSRSHLSHRRSPRDPVESARDARQRR
jgi:hypothetical protein